MKTDAVCSFETLISNDINLPRHNPEDHDFKGLKQLASALLLF